MQYLIIEGFEQSKILRSDIVRLEGWEDDRPPTLEEVSNYLYNLRHELERRFPDLTIHQEIDSR